MSKPTVSVVLPTYNRAQLLGDSVQSVLNQTYDDFELIVVDDASTDDTEDVIRDIGDSRVKYIEHDENEGAPAARNTGLKHADGHLISFQDSDDTWEPRKLELQVRSFENASSNVGVVYTGMMRERDHSTVYIPYSSVEMTEGDIRSSISKQNFIPTQTAMVRKQCFDEVGYFDEKTWPISDWELWIRISKQYQFDLVDEALVTGKVRPDSISKAARPKVEARKRIVGKHRSFFDDNSLSRQLFFIGHGFMKLGETTKGRAYLKRAAEVNPDARRVGALLFSYLGVKAYKSLYRYYKRRPTARRNTTAG